MDDDDDREAPPFVTAAVAAGTCPLPFLAVYAVMFVVHGKFHRSVPPDVTSSSNGEFLVGLLCLALLVAGGVALVWLLNGRRRWPFVVMQAVFFGVAVDFVLDSTKGGPLISAFVAVASAAALVLCAHPQAWEWMQLRCPAPFALLFGQRQPAKTTPTTMPAGSMDTSDVKTGAGRLVGRRRASR